MCRKYTQFVAGKQGQTLAGVSVDISWNRCYNIKAVGREHNERTESVRLLVQHECFEGRKSDGEVSQINW